jgi:hypothetical protein
MSRLRKALLNFVLGVAKKLDVSAKEGGTEIWKSIVNKGWNDDSLRNTEEIKTRKDLKRDL